MKLIRKIGLLLLVVFMAVSCTTKKDGDSINNSYEEKTKRYACVLEDEYSKVDMVLEGNVEIESFEMKYELKIDNINFLNEEEFMELYNEITNYFDENLVSIDIKQDENSFVMNIVIDEFNKYEDTYNAIFNLFEIENGSDYLKIDDFIDYVVNDYINVYYIDPDTKIECEEIK